jgi:hypothetical protein
MCGDSPTDTDPEKTAKRRDRAYHIAHYAQTSTSISAPADLEDGLSEDEAEGDEE